MVSKAERVISEVFANAGVKINGNNAWDIKIHNNNFYTRVLHKPSLGLGETYMEDWWDCDNLEEFFFRILRSNIESTVLRNPNFYLAILQTGARHFASYIFNYSSRRRAHQVGRHHYDLGNDLFQKMLDPTMNYSCAYWKNSNNLHDAQLAKLKLVCEKLQLQPGMKVLDIGCGWGSFAKYAAENYGVSVVGVTVSQEQAKLAQQLCATLPVEIRVQDYRLLNEKFDRVSSIGMFEHVGYKNYNTYMQVVNRCLKSEGLFLLHTIGNNVSTTTCDAWITKYIFPNGMLPSIKQIGATSEKYFVMEDWHNFGVDYAKTLMVWQENFIQYWDTLKQQYDERFYRMWNYYLLSCAAAFRSRRQQLWQVVLAKNGVLGGYTSVR